MLIFEDENLYVFFRPIGDTLIISFNEMEFKSTTGSWGGGAYLGAGLSSLGYVSKRPNWFPASSMKSSLEHVLPFIQPYAKRVTYGHSQGGYAAIKYAGHLGATSALSFCPQFSIDPADVHPIDFRFTRYYLKSNESPSIKATDFAGQLNLYVFYDPVHPEDRFNVDKIAGAFSAINRMKIFGTGHSSIRPFGSSQSLRKLVEMSLKNDTAGINRLTYECKKNWHQRRAYLARSLSRFKPGLAEKVIDGHFHLMSPEPANDMVDVLYLSGQYDLLARRGMEFAPSLFRKETSYVITAMHACNSQKEAVRLSNLYALKFAENNPTLEYLSPKILFPNMDWLVFLEGWSTPEDWGVWGVSRISKFVIDWRKLPASIEKLTFRVSQVNPGEISINSITASDFGSSIQELIVDERLTISRAGALSEVELHCSGLFCPKARGLGGDTRFLGVRLFLPDR